MTVTILIQAFVPSTTNCNPRRGMDISHLRCSSMQPDARTLPLPAARCIPFEMQLDAIRCSLLQPERMNQIPFPRPNKIHWIPDRNGPNGKDVPLPRELLHDYKTLYKNFTFQWGHYDYRWFLFRGIRLRGAGVLFRVNVLVRGTGVRGFLICWWIRKHLFHWLVVRVFPFPDCAGQPIVKEIK